MLFTDLIKHLDTPTEIASQQVTADHLKEWIRNEQVRLGRQLVCLEVGVFCGFTALQMAETGAAVVCVDTFRATDTQTVDRGKTFGGSTLERFLGNALATSPRGPVIGLVGLSHDIGQQLPKEAFDLVFIDGDHAYASVKSDLELFGACLRKDGVLAGHDIKQDSVARAVEEYGKRIGRVVTEYPDQLWRLS